MSRESKSTATGLALSPTKTGLTSLIPHPWAILFSLVIAFLVLALIDREIEDVIFSGELRVVAHDSGRANEIVVVLPSGFVMIDEPRVQTVASVAVKGPRRDRGRITPPFQAWLPVERLVNLGQDTAERVSLEAKDLRIQSVGSYAAEVQPLSILVAREGTVEKAIEAVLTGTPPDGYSAEVVLSPDKVLVTGPAFELARRSKVTVEVTLPALGQPMRLEIKDLALAERRLGMRWRPNTVVEARVTFAATDEVPFESSVRLVVDRSLGTAFEFELESPYDLERTPTLRFLGPKRAVERLSDLERRQKFQERVAVILDAERTAISRQDLLADEGWHTLEVPGYIPSNLLMEFGLMKGPELLPVPVKVRKKPPR